MTASRATDRRRQPSPKELRAALGPTYPLWERLTRFIHTQYQIEGKWSPWGPAELGWGFRYRWKSRSLVALYPRQERFVAQVVLGKAQAERALGLSLSAKTAKLLRETPQLRDGRWLAIPVCEKADAEDVEQLLCIKVRPVSDQPGLR